MNRRRILDLFVIMGFAFTAMPQPAVSQQKSLTERLVGTWTFVSLVRTNSDGTKTNPWGADPKGLFMFDPSGYFSVMISRSDIPNFASNNRLEGTADENKAVVQGTVAMIGTWSVDEASRTLITKIERGSFPNWNGTTQQFPIASLTADGLMYMVSAGTAGRPAEVTWTRAR